MTLALTPFTPSNTIAITVAATTATVAIPTPRGNQVLIDSLAGNAIAYVAFGISSVTAAVPTGTKQLVVPILPGQSRMFTVNPDFTHIATIGTAANTLYVMSGDGQ